MARELMRRGFEIVGRNVKIGTGRSAIEIDIVARSGCDYALVEVKTARYPTTPETMLHDRQRMRLARAEQRFRRGLPSSHRVQLVLAAVAVDRPLTSTGRAPHKPDMRFFRIEGIVEDSLD
ncbi:MAG: YraN family protein [Planctomycetes bacterium]|nr:YraN family protein [Planctomycetota bacterium]